MHVIRYYRKLDTWKTIALCKEQLDAINTFVLSSFQMGEKGEFLEIPASGYTVHDNFYEAQGSYTMFYTSNNWVNEALKDADVKTSQWSPFDKGVLYHIQREE